MTDLTPTQPSPADASGPTAPPTTRPTMRPYRWVVALITTIALLLGSLGIAAFAQTGSADGPTFLPAGSLAYLEARLDLPGDQRDAVIEFLGHFPGFADPASFDNKLDEALENLLGGEDSPLSWQDDIKPWFSGQVMLGLTQLPDMSAMPMGDGSATPPLVVAFGVTDRAALDATITKLVDSMGEGVTEESYAGTTIHADPDGDGFLAPTDTLLLFATDLAEIKSSLNVLAGAVPAMADDATFQGAMANLPEDRLGAFYVDASTLKEALLPLLTGGVTDMVGVQDAAEAALDALPLQITGVLRVDPDHVTVQVDAIPSDATPAISERDTELASRMPADTLVYLEARDVDTVIGQAIESIKAAIPADDEGAKQIAQIEQLLDASLEDYFDFAEDVALGVSLGEDGLGLGLAATVDDQETAEDRLASIIVVARLIINQVEDVPVTLTDAEVDGVDVFTFELGEGVIPDDVPIAPSFSIAVGEGLLLFGLGDFVSDALTRDPADSLAAAPSYVRALDAAGTPNGGIAYANLAGAVDLVEGLMGSDDLERYQADIKPYLEAMDYLVAVLDDAEGTISLRAMLFVK